MSETRIWIEDQVVRYLGERDAEPRLLPEQFVARLGGAAGERRSLALLRELRNVRAVEELLRTELEQCGPAGARVWTHRRVQRSSSA